MSDRHAEFLRWVAEVRDPANAASEGLRVFKVPHATAAYEIAPLPDGRYAVTMSLRYLTGDCYGSASPWTAYRSREDCIDVFLQASRRHFSVSPRPSIWCRFGLLEAQDVVHIDTLSDSFSVMPIPA